MAVELTRNSLLINLVSRLRQDFHNSLPPELDKAFVQEAYRELCGKRSWFGLMRTGFIILPGAGSALTAAFTQFDRVVTVTAGFKTYLDALPLLSATRMTIIAPDARPYHIHAWYSDDSVVLLDRPYFGDTAAAGTCSVLKAYLLPPYTAINDYLKDSTDTPIVGASAGVREDSSFRHFISIRKSGSVQDRLYYRSTPARSHVGLNPTTTPVSIHPLGICGPDYPGVAVDGPLFPGTPMFQLYPAYNGTATLIYECRYITTGGELSEDYASREGVLPAPFTTELLLNLARVKASAWCDANKANKPELQKTNWLQHVLLYQARYDTELDRIIQQDNELWSKDASIDGNSNSQWEALRLPEANSMYPWGSVGAGGGVYMIDPDTVVV
jgi:hypothetical protein